MLVLGRQESDKILIGDDIVITIVRVKGSRVTIGIDAPKEKRILRVDMPTGKNNNATVFDKSSPRLPSRSLIRSSEVGKNANGGDGTEPGNLFNR